jgi:hypothetical protein
VVVGARPTGLPHEPHHLHHRSDSRRARNPGVPRLEVDHQRPRWRDALPFVSTIIIPRDLLSLARVLAYSPPFDTSVVRGISSRLQAGWYDCSPLTRT